MKTKLITSLICVACLFQPSFGETTTPDIYFDQTTNSYGLEAQDGSILTETTYDGISEFHNGVAIVQNDGLFGVISSDGKELVTPTYKYITNFRNGYATVFLGDLAGALNLNGELVIPVEYDNISHFINGHALAYKDNKLGLISNNNEIVHPFVWDEAIMLDFEHDYNTFVFRQGASYGVAAFNGQILLSPQEKQLVHISDNQVAYVNNKKIGVMTHSGKTLIPAAYDSIYVAGKGYMGKKDGLYYFFNLEDGRISQPYDDVEDLANSQYLIMQNGKKGIYDSAGHRELLSTEYDDIKLLKNPYNETQIFFQVTKASTIKDDVEYNGVIDLNGDVLLPTLYTKLSFINDHLLVYEDPQKVQGTYDTISGYNSGLLHNHIKYDSDSQLAITVSTNRQYGIIDADGHFLVESTNDYIYENGNFFIVEKDEKKAFFSKEKQQLTPYKYDTVFSFQNIGETEAAIISIGNLWGLLNPNGSYLVPPEYDAINEFVNGYAIVSKDNKYGFINTKGELVVEPQFQDVSSFNDGLAIAKKDGHYGFIQSSGKFVIQSIYNHVKPFDENGHALVDYKGRMGMINKDGTYFLNPIYKNITPVADSIIVVQDSATKKYGILKSTGEEISKLIYDDIGSFFKEEATFVEINGKYALVNNKGEVLTQFIFDDMTLFNKGFATIQVGNQTGFINARGEYILE